MAKTKRRILDQSIFLFNKYGYANVSLHQIAKSLNLSSGNLTYHFPKKANLMNAVYNTFVDELLSLQASLGISRNIEEIIDELNNFIEFQNRFLFFYVDLLDIGRNYPSIAKRHYKHIQGQIARIQKNLEYNLKEKHIKATHKSELKILAETIWMTVVFWPSQNILRGRKNSSTELIATIRSIINPYLNQSYKRKIEHSIQNPSIEKVT